MEKRKFGKCEWCERTIDKTKGNELCNKCAKYGSLTEMILKEGVKNGKHI